MMDFLSQIQGAMGGGGGFDPNARGIGGLTGGAVRRPGAQMPPPAAAAPQIGGADPAQLQAAMAGMGAGAPEPMGMPPQPDQMAQDVRNERRKFRMGRTQPKVPGGARPGGFTGMGIGAPRDDGMWSRPGME